MPLSNTRPSNRAPTFFDFYCAVLLPRVGVCALRDNGRGFDTGLSPESDGIGLSGIPSARAWSVEGVTVTLAGKRTACQSLHPA